MKQSQSPTLSQIRTLLYHTWKAWPASSSLQSQLHCSNNNSNRVSIKQFICGGRRWTMGQRSACGKQYLGPNATKIDWQSKNILPDYREMYNSTQHVQIDVADSLRKKSKIKSKSKCCIYEVPEYTRKGYEECYRPSVISIGPVFYNDPKLEPLQELKLIFMKSFTEHPVPSLEPYISFVREKEEEIRECYQQKIRLSSDEFIEMIVLDSVFLIYWMLAVAEEVRFSLDMETPFMNNLDLHRLYIMKDSFLLENQLPFFVLTGMYDIAFGTVSPHLSFVDLALEYIRKHLENIHAPRPEDNTNESTIKHLLDFMMTCYCICPTNGRREQRLMHRIGTAKQLIAAGVKFKAIEKENQFDIDFDKNNGELTIPKLTLFDGVDSLYRNILFFEQFEPNSSFYFFDYIDFFDGLIDSVEDIQILEQNGILKNFFGSEQDVADLFNNFTKNLPLGHSHYLYSSVEKDLKEYTSTHCNKWKAIFWSKYFNHPWAIISVIAAVILFILTLLQTISSFTCK